MLQNDFLVSLERVEGLKKKCGRMERKLGNWFFWINGILARKLLVPLINSLWKNQKMRWDEWHLSQHDPSHSVAPIWERSFYKEEACIFMVFLFILLMYLFHWQIKERNWTFNSPGPGWIFEPTLHLWDHRLCLSLHSC